MTKYARKNQLKHAEMQGNKEQIAPGETGSRKMTRKSQKQIENQSQSGRSMVEMLGVLAIIAILSIGGIIGFRLAMNYYQANQIAHEMNMMRTDAQIKIAQGTEKLTLGSPYDPISESQLGHIQFNDDYPIDFACALADDEAVELSNISCHVANAYYIELQNIPEGVCRPLAELVNGMNNIIAFDVNKNEYPGEGKCEAGNENVLNAVFSAEAVSELKVCTGDTDCESENALYCDPSRHVCVRCYEDSQCEHNQYCEDNTCVTCESGVWNGEECVECTDNGDCADKTDTPVCNTDTNTCVECLTYNDCKNEERPQCDEASHTCKSCAEIDERTPVWGGTQCVECVNSSTDCEEALVCRENTCSPCEAEEECQAKGTDYHCSKEDTCIQCGANEVWDDESKECVECLSSADCKNPDKPQCNTTANKCVPCLTDSDCENPTPICSDENTCVACKTNDECRLKNPSEENCVTGGACCDDPLMTWNGSECVCPEDYAKSETSSGQAVCLPYCKQEVGVVLMVDQSSSLGWKNHDINQYSRDLYKENAQKIQKVISKLNIPDKLKAAVYLSGCYDEGGCSTGVCQYDKVPMPLSYGNHSAAEIKAALQIELEGHRAGCPCNYFINPLKDITQKICRTGQEKLIIVVFYDVDMTDNPYFNDLKQKCPQSIIYNISVEGHTFDAATKTYDLDQVLSNETTMQEYAEILNKEFKDHLCVERE